METYYCEKCNYTSNKKYCWEQHLSTKKHINFTKDPSSLTCNICNKVIKHKSSLTRHKKHCFPKEEDFVIDKDMILMLFKQNTELMEMLKQPSLINNNVNNVNNNNTTNSNNKHFNLNFFLNETCKDAMNIDEFVSSIKVNIEDLEHTGRRGYVEGISSIFIKNLNNLEHHLRPLHCSDSKREVLYIKNNNEWVKEKDDKPILTHAIKTIANENIKQIPIWKNLNPGCTLSDSKKNNTYLKILSNSMCGITQEETVNNVHKIISNISKEVFIDKKHYFI